MSGNPEAREAMNIEGPIGKRRGVVVFHLLVELVKGISKFLHCSHASKGKQQIAKVQSERQRGPKAK